MKKLFSLLPNNDNKKKRLKRFVEFEKGTHNDTCLKEGYFEAIDEFIKDILLLQ
jgi:hypothetical protein